MDGGWMPFPAHLAVLTWFLLCSPDSWACCFPFLPAFGLSLSHCPVPLPVALLSSQHVFQAGVWNLGKIHIQRGDLAGFWGFAGSSSSTVLTSPHVTPQHSSLSKGHIGITFLPRALSQERASRNAQLDVSRKMVPHTAAPGP